MKTTESIVRSFLLHMQEKLCHILFRFVVFCFVFSWLISAPLIPRRVSFHFLILTGYIGSFVQYDLLSAVFSSCFFTGLSFLQMWSQTWWSCFHSFEKRFWQLVMYLYLIIYIWQYTIDCDILKTLCRRSTKPCKWTQTLLGEELFP